MMRIPGFAVFLALMLAALFPAPTAAQDLNNASPEMLDGRHLIIAVTAANRRAAIQRMNDFAGRHPVEPVTVWPLRSIAIQCLVVRVRNGASVAATIRALGTEAGVRIVQPVNAFRVSQQAYRDELFEKQRAMRRMNIPAAHEVATGRRVSVAVIDTGVDTGHPDLRRRISMAKDFVDDGRGATAREAHGTAIAGVLAADGRNGRGIVGVAPDARVLALRACWEEGGSGRCTSFSLARALNFAILQRVSIINLSLGGPSDPLVADLIEEAISRNIVVVSARGRTGFPANLPGVIAADSRGGSGGRVPAPGTDVLTTLPGGRYGFRSGSSISAGHVSGVAALIKQARPSAAPAQIRSTLRQAARGGLDACLAVVSVARGGNAADC
ncbi:MAG: S8 family serine peptidase [Pseudomonadota bacterium]